MLQPMATPPVYDCVRCGACCKNTRDNMREGFVDYVEVEKGDAILKKPDLLRRFVILNNDNAPHLRLDNEGRCLALRGALGRKVSCVIYHDRPSPCRRVQAGSNACIVHRQIHGIE